VEELTDVEHKKLELQRQDMHLQHKKADTEQLLALGRLNKEGQLTDIEFAHAKASLLLSPASIGEGHRASGSPMIGITTSPTTRFKDMASANISGLATSLEYQTLAAHDFSSSSGDQLIHTDWSLRLRQELNGLKPEELRLRAKYAGATARKIERAEDRAALIDLTIANIESLRQKLSHLSLRNLLQRAERLAVPHHEIEQAEASADVKDRLVELVARAVGVRKNAKAAVKAAKLEIKRHAKEEQKEARKQRHHKRHRKQRYEEGDFSDASSDDEAEWSHTQSSGSSSNEHEVLLVQPIASQPASALDHILVELKSDGHVQRPVEKTKPSMGADAPRVKRLMMHTASTSKGLPAGSVSVHEMKQLGDEQAPSLNSSTKTKPNMKAATLTLSVAPNDTGQNISGRSKALMDSSSFVELQDMVSQLGVEEAEIEARIEDAIDKAKNPKAALAELVVLYEGKGNAIRVQKPLTTDGLTPLPPRDQGTATAKKLLEDPSLTPLSAVPVTESAPAATAEDEIQAAQKVQAMWRGKAGQKKAVEQRKTTLVGSKRIVVAKRTIRCLQVGVTLLVMLSTAVSTLLPTYVIGATYGATANGEGFDGGLGLNIGLRWFVYGSTSIFMQMELFAAALRDTPFVPSTAERIVRPLLTGGVGHVMWAAGWWMLADLENPEADLNLIKGVPGAIVTIVGLVLVLDCKGLPIELWRLYRSRNHALPPANARTWWQTTSIAGKGTFVAALLLCAWGGLGELGYAWIFISISSYFDKAETYSTHLGDEGFVEMWVYKYYLVIVVPVLLLALVWAKRWPQGVRDPVSTLVLCALQQAMLYQGSFAAFNLYAWLGGPNGFVLGCQILIEVLMLLLYLYGRTLARRAFGTAPTYEARALFMYLLLSDGA
jgi:hypothetical protein